MKKFLMIGILMALGVFAYGNFAFAIVPIMDFDLGLVPSYLTGEGAGYQNSWSVSNAGDVNGDGYDDFLIGVPLNNNANGWRAGKTYLFLGKGGGWFGWQMGINLPGGGASFIGETGGDWSGYSVSGAGDVNGDGYDDFLIGARFSDDNGNESGKTYLFLGDDPIPWGMNTSISNADASFIGTAGSHSGYRVSNAGNVNGDSYDDFLISAVHNWGGVYNAGKTFLFLGDDPIPWGAGTDLSNADASFVGEGSGDISGCSLSSVGDVNNDGKDDFLIGAYRNEDGGTWMDWMAMAGYQAGKTYLFLGDDPIPWVANTNLSNANASFIGETADEWSGYSVSGVGDVDNDNFDDFIIGAPRYDEIGVGDVGKTYLILGKPTAGWTTNVDLSNSDASFIGEIPVWGDESGYSVSGVGDVNNDNHDDFIIGARGNGQGGFDLGHGAGQTYLILGKPTVSWTNNVNLVNADASFIGDNPGDECGWRVSGAGDVNKDGTDDFLISASLNDGGGVRSGRTYLILTEAPVSVTIEAEDKNGVLISDGGAIWDYDNGPVTISSVALSSVGLLLSHTVEVKMGAGPWIPLFSCWDADSNGYCDFHPTVNISNLKLDDGSDIAQLQIGPFPAGTVINYRSSATDTVAPPNTGSSATKSFSVGTTWAKAFGGTGSDIFSSIQQTADGGYIVAGWTFSYGAGNSDSLILKLDSNGVQEWAKTFGGTDPEYVESIRQTADGGYIVSGYTDSYGAGFGDSLILKLDSNGVQEWAKTFGGTDPEYVESIRQTADGGYIVSGYTDSYGLGSADSLILKLDSNGVQEWAKTFGGVNWEHAHSIQQTADGGYVVAGNTDSYGAGNSDSLILKLDSNGVQEWAKTFGGIMAEYVSLIQQTADGGYIAAGWTFSYGLGSADSLILKLDSNGVQEWAKTFGGVNHDYTYSIQQTIDGGYIMTGQTRSYGAGLNDSLILKLDSNGVQEWAKTFGGVNHDCTYSIQQTLDGGYIVSGYTDSYGAGNYDSLILKLDSNGMINNCSPPLADVFPIGETGPFATGETGPFATGETGPFATGETGPFATGETNPFPIGEVDVCLGCNTAPTVNAGAANQPTNYCGKAPQANLHWVFADADVGDSQGHFQVQVDDDALFGSPIIDTGKLPGSANSYNTILFTTLAYNTTYHWRVKVWDDQAPGAESVYSTGTSFLTPLHKYPCADFTFSPASPLAGDIVDFDASVEGPCSCTGVGSQAYGAGVPIVDYSWDFDGDSIIDASGALPTANYTYIAEGSYSIELIVTDSSGFSCPSCAQTVTVGKGMPKWKEVVPR